LRDEIVLLSKRPIKLKSTRTWRTYTGGKLIEEWQGNKESSDSEFPEEWIASVVKARNPGRENILDEGLSRLELEDGRNNTLKDIIEDDPVAFLGEDHYKRFGANLGVLVKILDSAERLTIQVHPDNVTAQKLFNSVFGKTEAWFFLGGREIEKEVPYILLGFKPGITKDKWQELFEKQDIDGMLGVLNKFNIKPGDVYLIEGGVPHAIGPGCFLAEIQEPTDYTIRVERTTPKGRNVPDTSCHQGIGFDKMFDCFHYDGYNQDEVIKRWNLKPRLLTKESGGSESALIAYDNTPKFAMNLIEVEKSMTLEKNGSFSIIIVLFGKGRISWKEGSMEINQGEQVFLPFEFQDAELINSNNKTLSVIRCFPPVI
jgi:mannose-6-phosphate isomerase